MIQLATMGDEPFTKRVNGKLGFNLSETFENHLEHLITQFSTGNSVNNFESTENKLRMVDEIVAINFLFYSSFGTS